MLFKLILSALSALVANRCSIPSASTRIHHDCHCYHRSLSVSLSVSSPQRCSLRRLLATPGLVSSQVLSRGHRGPQHYSLLMSSSQRPKTSRDSLPKHVNAADSLMYMYLHLIPFNSIYMHWPFLLSTHIISLSRKRRCGSFPFCMSSQ